MSISLMLVLRTIHIVAGIFWAGAVFMIAGFLEPTMRAVGAKGAPFMQHLMGRSRLSQFITVAAILTVVSGIWILWILSNGFQGAWLLSGMGLSLSIGGLLALVAMVMGITINRPTAIEMDQLRQAMHASEGPPSAEQVARMQHLQARLRMAGRVAALLLFLAVVGMAVARYLPALA